jgi:ABC-2 type transport system ATP-binding protein
VDDALSALRERFAANRCLVVELTEPAPPLQGLAGVVAVAVEAQGLRQRLEFTPATTAAGLIAAVADRVPLRDVAIAEPTIEDMVRTLYATDRATPH